MARVVSAHLDNEGVRELALHLRDVGDEEDLGEPGLLDPRTWLEYCILFQY